jgi:lysophospholipase L1-like esterase
LMLSLLLPSVAMGQHVTYSPFMHYTDRVKEFDKMRSVDSTDIVMLGNSLTEFGGDWSQRLKARHVRNRGIAGDDAEGILQRLSQITPGHPRAIFLMVGINDLSHDLSAQEVAARCEKVIARIIADSPSTKLYVQSLLPINESFGRWKSLEGKTNVVPQINRLLRAYCKRKGIGYINLFPFFVRHGSSEMRKELTVDGLHLTPQGYKQWVFVLKKYVDALE